MQPESVFWVICQVMTQFPLTFRRAWLCRLAVICGLLIIAPLYAQHKLGYIQVTCEPGVQVFLDGELKGVTSAGQGGLILSGVSASRHQLRFEKEGCYLQVATVMVSSTEVLAYKVHPFTAKPETTDQGSPAQEQLEQKSGSLQIQSLPVACKISITGLEVNGYEKYRDEVEFDKLPIGTYTAVFSALGKSVERTFAITNGECTRLFVNILEGNAPEVAAQPQVGESVPAGAVDSGDAQPITELDLKTKTQAREDKPQVGQSVPAIAPDSGNNHSSPIADRSLKIKAQELAAQPQTGADVPTIAKDTDENRSITDLGLKLIWIGPGSFAMGNAQVGEGDEKPVTEVSISRGFWLGRTEVTQAQWRAIMGKNPARFQGDELPVEAVSWHEAMEFCRKLTQRESAVGRLPSGYAYTLPTEAQWEYACRAGTAGNHAGDPERMAWYAANSGGTTKPVGQKEPNAWGLHDMHGNVWEWCLDWYGSYPGGSVTNPKGAASGIYRVMRGGSWNNSADYCRSSLRLRDEPVYRRNYLGLRVALSVI